MVEPLKIVVEATARPGTIRITVNRDLTASGGLSYNSPSQAAGHPLGQALLAIPGVRSIYMLGNFLTVTLHDGSDWRAIGPVVQARLHEVLG